MAKKIQDIKLETQNKEINLKTPSQHQVTPGEIDTNELAKKNKNNFYKQQTPINEIEDIKGKKKEHFIYIKGQKFIPPKSLGNLLKIGFIGFFIILFINAINVYYAGKKIENNLSIQASESYGFLVDAGKNASRIQFDKASESFQNALKNFDATKNELWFLSTDKSYYSNQNNIAHAVNALLLGGQHFSAAGGYFLDALEEFNKIPLYFVTKNNNPEVTGPSLTGTIKDGLDKTNEAVKEISLASDQLAEVNENTLPSSIATRISSVKKQVEEVSQTLNMTASHFPAILKLLGNQHPHRYLILLQNNNEIRPAGGFIGSYAILDVNDGIIQKLDIKDVYDIDGSYGGVIEPPDFLKKFINNWRFRDSNYSADFPTTAAKAKWFLEKEGGPSVDTVIAINQGLLKDLLDITGPVQVGDFGKLNSDNYNLLLSYVIEGKVWGPQDPKHILKIFIPAFEKDILKEENISRVGSKLYKAIQQKHIMMYSGDTDVEGFFDALGVSGRVYENKPDEDYLSVVNYSVGGTKSDQFIEENILHDTYIDKGGNITDEVTIKRSHLWNDAIYYQWKKTLEKYGFKEMPDQIIDILGRGMNKVYMKVYVPDGSILLNASDNKVTTEYDKDLKKTYFATEVDVSAGKTTFVKLKYRLPFTLNFNDTAGSYKLIAQKQPGSVGSIFTKTVSTDPEIHNLSVYPNDAKIDSSDHITYPTNLVYDKYFSGIWQRK